MARFMPVRAGTYQISSKFGPRGGGMHWGMDFAASGRDEDLCGAGRIGRPHRVCGRIRSVDRH